jgi:signal transduction histidine kinase
MPTGPEIPGVNWIILYFVYGQVFFIMGLVTGLQWRRRSRLELARTLPWLAAFGLAHGLNEWGHIFIPLQAVHLSPSVVNGLNLGHLALLAVSYYFLFQFGIELLRPMFRRQVWLRFLPAVVLLLWAVAVLIRWGVAQDSLDLLTAIGNGWARYALGFPGAILAHLGLIRQARQVREMGFPRIAIYLTGAAMAFSVYAVAGGLVVPTAPLFPASVLNYDLLLRTVRVPAPVFRSLCGLAMAFFVVRFLDVFQVETDRLIDEMEHHHLLAADRERIGRELHDGIIQDIYAAGLSLEHTLHLVDEDPNSARRKIQGIMQGLDRTIQDIRNYIFDLQAAEQNRELETVLENLVHDLRLDTLLEVELEILGAPCCVPSQPLTAHLSQIAREALSNVVQHANADRVLIRLSYEGQEMRLVVTDDGVGIKDLGVSNEDLQGHGIPNMQARARLMGGDLNLQSVPGQGTRVKVIVPCDREENYDG